MTFVGSKVSILVESVPREAHEHVRASRAVRVVNRALDLAEHLIERIEVSARHALAVQRVALIRKHGKNSVRYARFEKRKRRGLDADKRIVDCHAIARAVKT